METLRGQVRNQERNTQRIDFSGLRFLNITPSNLDGVLDFGGVCFIFLEFKVRGKGIECGQRLLYENLCRVIDRARRMAIAVAAWHDVQDSKQEIIGADCDVVAWFNPRVSRSEWQIPSQQITVREFIEDVLKRYHIERYLRHEGMV